ncbi:MAG: hypothetical protein IT378_20580 [Sandaracinaceae bacterium]|nr:hypothetical protein [Sandaracinaceae bacterium]
MADRTTRSLALVALAVSLVALVLALYSVHEQRQSEERLRSIGRELRDSLTPALPLRAPPPGLDPDPA